jgi:TrwC relaxase
VRDALSFIERHALFTRQGRKEVRQVNVTGLVAAAFTHRDSRAGDPNLHTHVAVANKVQALDGRWLSIDGRVLSKATVAPVVMLPLASLSWTVILEVESPSAGIEVGDAAIVDASGSVSGSGPIRLRARPHRIGWHGGSAGVHWAHSEHDQQDHSRAM